VEPDKLEWMKPIDSHEGQYSDLNKDSLLPSELRFEFKGNLISPRASTDPKYLNKGLHHHGDSPAAAGYTIGELAHLARSTNQSQRCIAIQTLGRILYKIGKQHYGPEISTELQKLTDYVRVVDTLYEALNCHIVSVEAYATEALWLQKQANPQTDKVKFQAAK
jgi:hypothetical protein